MKVNWQTPAKVGRRKISAYIRKEFGTKHAKKFKQEVDDTVKMVYRVEDDTIHIVGFWDTRMNDEDQASQVK